MTNPSTSRALGLALLALAALPAQALVVLGFEGVNATYPSSTPADIAAFYAGGVSSQGTSGVNYGINFSPNAIAVCLNAVAGSCSNASRGGLSVTSSQGALGLSSNGSAWFDVPAGFTFAIGFSYAVLPGSLATIAACAESIGLQAEMGATAQPTELLRIIDLEVQRCKKWFRQNHFFGGGADAAAGYVPPSA